MGDGRDGEVSGASVLLAALLALAPASGWAQAEPDSATTAEAPELAPEGDEIPVVQAPAPASSGLEALVPEVAAHPYRIDPGEREFLHRFAFSPGYGTLGTQRLFSFRLAYNPNRWLAYEGTLSHNPGQSVHAVLHTLSAIVRHPLAGRYQPYLTAGYGMMIVFPGQSLNAASVTKNALTLGGGLEFYIRSDLAIRAEMAQATVLGRQRDRDGVVAYNYLQQTIGLAFYRSIRP
jgi:opacity protein-like surface antigen